MSLFDMYQTNTGRPINKWAHYFPIYERYFQPFQNRAISFLEIGAGQGGSSQLWKRYFGPLAQIVSIDIRPECAAFQDEQVAIRIGDQTDPRFLRELTDEFGPFDLVLDDGSHIMDHVNASFRFLFPRMSREALYFVEDMHTSYWEAWGGGLRKPGTFIEEMKNVIDELHAGNPHHDPQRGGDIPASELSRLIRGVHFYDSVVVVEKGPFVTKRPASIPFVEGETIW